MDAPSDRWDVQGHKATCVPERRRYKNFSMIRWEYSKVNSSHVEAGPKAIMDRFNMMMNIN